VGLADGFLPFKAADFTEHVVDMTDHAIEFSLRDNGMLIQDFQTQLQSGSGFS